MRLILIVSLLLQVNPFDSALHTQSVAQGKPDVDRDVQRIAMEGWAAARAIAPRGGALELLGPVNIRLRELDAVDGLPARYAEVAIRAAVSAAQEERDEMGLLLVHARDLSNQMALIGTPAEYPLPIDELEGELWFEVDRFTESRDAYER